MMSSAPQTGWGRVTCSADGSTLFAIGDYSSAYSLPSFCVSTNSGFTWTATNLSTNRSGATWGFFTCSADGSRVLATISGTLTLDGPATNYFFSSSDFGATWGLSAVANGIKGAAICSADGARLVAAGSQTYISTNGGANWIITNSIPNSELFTTVAASADGMKLIGASSPISPHRIYTSTNGGFQWTQTAAPILSWKGLASSADGCRLAAIGAGPVPFGSIGPGVAEPIYTSTDSGLTWKSNNVPPKLWKSIASSADGNKLVAAVEYFDEHLIGEGIWTAQITPAPYVQIMPTDNSFKVSWLVPSTNFVLQQSADLSAWHDLTNLPAMNFTNLQDEVSLPTSSGVFFRLRAH
jgi:hypothetical protein